MKLKMFSAALLSIATAMPVAAAPIELELKLGYGVKASFFGLDDTKLNVQAADEFSLEGISIVRAPVVLPNPDVSSNSFSFDQFGELNSVDFFYRLLIDDAETYDSFILSCASIYCYYEEDSDSRYLDWGGPFTYSITPIAPVSLPAGGVLLLTGFAGVAALKRCKKAAA